MFSRPHSSSLPDFNFSFKKTSFVSSASHDVFKRESLKRKLELRTKASKFPFYSDQLLRVSLGRAMQSAASHSGFQKLEE